MSEDYQDVEIDFVGEGDYDDDGVEMYEDGPIRPGATIIDIYYDCLEPSITQVFSQFAWVLCACLVLRLLNQHISVGHHILSALLGLVALFSVVGSSAVCPLILGVFGYFAAYSCSKKPGVSLPQWATFILLLYLVAREYIPLIREDWDKEKGIQMIMTMKIASICFDMGIGYRTIMPRFEEYLGYILCPANVIFGPWIPFEVYCRIFDRRNSGLRWIVPACWACVWSFVSLGVSTCMLYWVFLGNQSRWLLTIRDAMSVRFSHYFISFLSEFCCLLSGCESDLSIAVVEPWNIEFPRSLEEVVVAWNIPMHQWLKVYIYRPSVRLGRFQSVLFVFVVSSMLHGLNFGLTSVLLSLGIYSHVEGTLREKLAAIFDACIRSRQCRANCSHKYKADNFSVLLVNLGFGLLAFFNLAYLGIMISNIHVDSDETHSVLDTIHDDIKKWSDLSFASHWVMFFVYVGTLVI